MKLSDIYMRDPFVFVEDNIAFLVGTTESENHKCFLGYKSNDLINFDGPFILFEASNDFWANQDFWAPELHKINGKYLLIASFSINGKNRKSQILVSDSPLGKYTPLEKPFTPDDWMSLDATLYEEDGKLYTIFSHEWLQISDGEIVLGELNDDLCSLKTKPVTLFKASSAPWVKSILDNKYVTDGPFIYKLSNGNLCLLWSSFSEGGYSVGMAISSNGIYGPWKHIDEPLFKENGGHAMVFEFKNQLYLSLHYPNSPHLLERPHFYKIKEENGVLVRID